MGYQHLVEKQASQRQASEPPDLGPNAAAIYGEPERATT